VQHDHGAGIATPGFDLDGEIFVFDHTVDKFRAPDLKSGILWK
jgi:hypothetical protein